MKHTKCKICGKEHALGGCPEFQSTAARKEHVQNASSSFGKAGSNPEPKASMVKAPNKAEFKDQPVDTHPKTKIGRPRTGFNKKEYNRQFTADLRTIKRLGLNCTVGQYRESLK